MSNRKFSTLYRLCLITFGLLLVGCTEIEVVNTSDVDLRVLLRVPDRAGGITRSLPAGWAISTFSENGGPYSVTILRVEEYREYLLSLRELFQEKLFFEAGTLSPSDVAALVQNLAEIEDALNRFSSSGGYCDGRVADFETVTVTITWNEESGYWEMNCP